MDTKRCSRCRETKPLGEFYRNASRKDGHSQMCQSCHSAYSVERRLAKALEVVAVDERFVAFGKLVRAKRMQAGLSQEALGKRISVTGTQIRLWELGKAYPRNQNRMNLCAALGIEIPLSLKQSKTGLFPYEVKNCANCGKPFPVYKRGIDYCSRKCSGEAQSRRQVGEANPAWTGGRINAGLGYVKVKARNHPSADQRGYVLEHRLVMERQLGRYLQPRECVHHKNGQRADNRPENLELWTVRKKDPAGQRSLDLAKDIIAGLTVVEQAELKEWLSQL